MKPMKIFKFSPHKKVAMEFNVRACSNLILIGIYIVVQLIDCYHLL